MQCLYCKVCLTGQQRKYCSHRCLQNDRRKSGYQKDRSRERKRQFVLDAGGKCCLCGYDKNLAILEFHHIDPEKKNFQLSSNEFICKSIEELKREAKLCRLLCANCHREEHNPDYQDWN